jgi:hypothetical protein
MEIDKWASFSRKTPEFISQVFYGEIEYYLVYEFNNKTYMLAYIHWAADIEEDSVGLISFRKYGAYEFIDAFAIDHCVGFFQLRNAYYVIDNKEYGESYSLD